MKAEMIRLRCAERLSAPQVAKRVGVCHHTAYKYLAKFKNAPTDATPKGGLRATWTNNEIAALRKLWPTASRADIEAAIPNRSFETVGKMATKLKIRRPSQARRENKRHVHPLIVQLHHARIAQNMTIKELARRAGHHPVETHEWEMGKKTPKLLTFIDCANALGFDVYLRPRLSDVITPDRNKMMGSK
jgi:DNA-binding XRE family transcriptional regulator